MGPRVGTGIDEVVVPATGMSYVKAFDGACLDAGKDASFGALAGAGVLIAAGAGVSSAARNAATSKGYAGRGATTGFPNRTST